MGKAVRPFRPRRHSATWVSMWRLLGACSTAWIITTSGRMLFSGCGTRRTTFWGWRMGGGGSQTWYWQRCRRLRSAALSTALRNIGTRLRFFRLSGWSRRRVTRLRRSTTRKEHALRQLTSKAVVSPEVVDIFSASGLKKPNVGILSDEFLEEVRRMKQRNLAVELLERLLKGEIRSRLANNIVQSRNSRSYCRGR